MKRYAEKGMLAVGVLATALLVPVAHASVLLSNATTEVTVYGGDLGSANPLIDYGGYFSYVDIATGTETTWSVDPVLVNPAGAVSMLSNGLLSSPVDNAGSADSSATVGQVSVTASTTLTGTHATTTFTFTGDLDAHQFLFYAENDLFGFNDDVAGFSGSIGGGDLLLTMYDSLAVSGGSAGLTIYLDAEVTGGAVLSAFGSGLWTEFGDALTLGNFSVLSDDGVNFVTGPGDLGLALLFDLSGTFATIVVDYYTTPDLPPGVRVPEPATVVMLLLGLLGMSRRRWLPAR